MTDEIKATAEQETKLVSYTGDDRVICSSEMREEIRTQPKNSVHFNSKIEGLDALVGGFDGGELVAISGPTKNGKTLLAQTLTVGFAEQDINSLWFSFEVPTRQFLGQVPVSCEFYLPRILVPHSPSWLDDRIVESKLKHNTRAVFVDHLHFLIDMERGGRNLSVDIGAVIRRLKRTAIRHNIVLFLLAHATKGTGPNGEVRELGAMDLRDSSFIPQEADSTWIVQRKMDKDTKEFNNKAMLKICNHRRTGVMEKRITLVKDGYIFKEWFDPDKPMPIKEPPYFPDMEVCAGEHDESLPF